MAKKKSRPNKLPKPEKKPPSFGDGMRKSYRKGKSLRKDIKRLVLTEEDKGKKANTTGRKVTKPRREQMSVNKLVQVLNKEESAATTSSMFFGDVDGRTYRARRLKTLMRALIMDFGGLSMISISQRNHIQSIAMFQVMKEDLEGEYLSGCIHVQPGDVMDAYKALSNSQVTIGRLIGVKRVQKDMGKEMTIEDFEAKHSDD